MNTERFLEKNDFEYFLDFVKELKPNLQKELILEDIKQNNKLLHEKYNPIWYESIKDNFENPAYWIYGEDLYLSEVLICWKRYSKKYINLLKKYNDENNNYFGKVRRILDVGCGIGFSTLYFSKLFPKAEIIGTNLKDTLQWEINEKLFKNTDNVKIVDGNLSAEGNFDIIFASEFFEHVVNPIELLNQFLDKYKPKFMIFANTFAQPAIGHFNKYYNKGVLFSANETSRLFWKTLRGRGYKKVDTGFFNGRPTIYELTNSMDDSLF